MKLLLFSHGITQKAADKLAEFAGKKVEDCNVLCITTAANTYTPDPDWLLETIDEIKSFGFKVKRFDLEEAYNKQIDIKDVLSDIDIIYISGGNTFYLMYWINKIGFKDILKEFLNNGGVYSGASAGLACVTKDITPISLVDDPLEAPKRINNGMNLIDIAIVPHWGNIRYEKELGQIKEYYDSKGYKTITLKDYETIVINKDEIEHLK